MIGGRRLEACGASDAPEVVHEGIDADRRSPSVRDRRIDDGCTVAVTRGASGESRSSPRCCVTRKLRPRIAWAAVAPSRTHLRLDPRELGIEPGDARADLLEVGLLVEPSLPSHHELEVLDNVREVDLITNETSLLDRALERAPAGPTKGRPARSSRSPGCSPTITIRASSGPSPKTVWVESL